MQDVLGHVFGVRRGEAHAHVGHGTGHQAQQLGKRSAVGRTLAIGQQSVAVHVLAQQSHLFESLVVQVAHLLEYAFHVAATLTAAGKGHDTVVAEVVAAAHDAHETADAVASNALGYHVAVGLRGREGHVHGRQSVLRGGHHLGQVQVRVGTANQVGMVVLHQVVLHALGHAAQNPQYRPCRF